MAKRVAARRELWESFDFRNRSYLRFNVRLGNRRQVSFTVAAKIADRYQVRDVLARGGGGVILVADDLKTEHAVLIKALAEYDTDRYDLNEPIDEIVETVRRKRHHLQSERRILVQLRNSGCNAIPHPNDFVFDTNPGLEGPYRTDFDEPWRFEDDLLIASEPYLVMQHVAGMSLKELLENQYQNGFDEPIALRIIDQAARVLERIQQPLTMSGGQTWELVYQDLKPGNILVDRYGHVTVIDFGGCQIVVDGTLVLQGSHTRGYSAAECGVWDQPILPSADSYGLGTTLFHLLSGINPRSLFEKHQGNDESRPFRIDTTPLRRRCSEETVALVAKAVSWELEARFENVTEFRRSLGPLRKST